MRPHPRCQRFSDGQADSVNLSALPAVPDAMTQGLSNTVTVHTKFPIKRQSSTEKQQTTINQRKHKDRITRYGFATCHRRQVTQPQCDEIQSLSPEYV
ncbi:hypothetical protein VTL71DRAFT_12640 [Oculimacula yallundae]|uniref:Uncharacterized protein n=1 Tax=Oculimacula yallundae TaxID=86028 RepID=A0ABR4CN51_9HELO